MAMNRVKAYCTMASELRSAKSAPFISMAVDANTMATASLSIDSPNAYSLT